jgi:hypothetical protein
MATFDITALTPETTSLEATENRAGRKAGPNPFVDKGWLQNAFENPQQVTVPIPAASGVVNAIRNAANRLNLGATIQVLVDNERWDDTDSLRYLRQLAEFADTKDAPESWADEDVKTARGYLRKNATVKYVSKTRRQRKNGEVEAPTDTPNGE